MHGVNDGPCPILCTIYKANIQRDVSFHNILTNSLITNRLIYEKKFTSSLFHSCQVNINEFPMSSYLRRQTTTHQHRNGYNKYKAISKCIGIDTSFICNFILTIAEERQTYSQCNLNEINTWLCDVFI